MSILTKANTLYLLFLHLLWSRVGFSLFRTLVNVNGPEM